MAAAQVVDGMKIPATQVFEVGNHETKSFKVETSDPSAPPKQLYVVTPTEKGTYPVFFFLPGTSLRNTFYSALLLHISSHGFIVISPQLYNMIPPSGQAEVNSAAAVVNWLPIALHSVLPEKVQPDLRSLIFSGHSRGGKAAFSLALGQASTATALACSAVVGVDPVAGPAPNSQLRPKVLTYTPNSIELGVPVIVIGSGLGDEVANCMMLRTPCAPEGVSHEQFYTECMPAKGHFVAVDYGHMDILDDNPPGMAGMMSGCMCKNGKGAREVMRRGVGGVVVAFLRYVEGLVDDLKAIVENPTLAPTKLDPAMFLAQP